MLNGKVAIVTGASSGIGASLAKALARDGATVVLAARRKGKLDEVSAAIRESGGQTLVIPCDVTERVEAEALIHRSVKELSRLDILINNAGSGHFSDVEDTTDEMIRNVFAVNVFSLWYTVRPALAQMKKQGSGHILNIASMAGKIGYPYNSAYVAAKHACVGFTHALRMELLETGIHASVVCPAGVATDWANVTEGGPIRAIFSASGPIVKRIAIERGIALPAIEGVISPDKVAEKIVACVYHPVPEVYTHEGSEAYVVQATERRDEAERHQLPVVLGEREVYERIRAKR